MIKRVRETLRAMKFWAKVALVSFIAVAGGMVFSCFVGSRLMAPAHRIVPLPLAVFKGSELQFQSGSGAQLKGNLLPGQRGKGAVILMHGIRGNRGDMAEHAQFLNGAGYTVLIFDFQAHGESSGTKITSGYLESQDAIAAMHFLRSKAPGERIAVLGVSLGGAAALLAGAELNADAMILEMVYPDIERAVKNRIEIVLGKWARPFSPFLTWQLNPRIGVGTDWFSPERAIVSVGCPKLIVAGNKDLHTRLNDSKALFASAAGPKELWIIEGAAHQNLHAFSRKEYERRVLEFLMRTLQTAPFSGEPSAPAANPERTQR
jgi:uncharacterized protein